MKNKTTLGNQSGFTLIEIIAVLIIIGILAAVAVPKYFDLTTEAKDKAIAAAGAEVQARLNQAFAEQLLSESGACTTALGNVDDNALTTNLGDFSVASFSVPDEGSTTSITITDTKNSYSRTYTIRAPDCP